MRQTDDVFESLNWSVFRMIPDLFENNGGKGARESVVIKFLFLVLIILLFVGDEAVKLLFRKGFGTKGVHWWKALLCVLIFGGLGYYSWGIGENEFADMATYGSTLSFQMTGVFYCLLAPYLFYKAFLQKRNRKAENYYRGDSTLLSFLMKSGWSQARVQNLAEPLTLLSVGTFLSIFNPFLGMPLMFCAISSWLTYAVETITGGSQVRDTLAKHGYRKLTEEEYANVIY